LFSYNNLKDIKLISNEVKDVAINDLTYLPQDKEKKYLFIATEGRGIIVYNTLLNRTEFSFIHDENNPYSIPHNVITKLYLDKKERLWLSTGFGISMLDMVKQQLKMRVLTKNSGVELGVNKIARDKYDSTKVWMSSYNKGMICVNWKTKKIEKAFKINAETSNFYDFTQVSRNKWLIVSQKKIIEWDEHLGILTATPLPLPDSLALVCNMRAIIMAGPNTYFITTNKGLFKYNLLSRKVDIVSKNDMLDKSEDRLKYILLDGFYDKGVIWAASRNGLFSYNTLTKQVASYSGAKGRGDYFFFDITKAGDNQIVCASGAGIAIFNRDTKKFKIVNSIAGLYKPACESVININNTIWIGSEVGILNYNLSADISERAEHETAMMQIYPSSPFTHIGNDIVFGFGSGYAYFTQDLRNNSVPSTPVIEDIEVNNQPVLLPAAGQKKAGKLIFNHSSNSINIAFTSFLYSDPDHINFRYRLKGADQRWQYVNELRSANYAQLPPGDYTFLRSMRQ